MSAWGWAVRRLTADEIERRRQTREKYEAARGSDGAWYTRCKVSPKCTTEATHEVTYSYTTGRAGRVSWAAKPACTPHALSTAKSHDIEIMDSEPQRHALDRALDGDDS